MHHHLPRRRDPFEVLDDVWSEIHDTTVAWVVEQ
jgi:hypothetical protein